jgi:CcmD family protein
MSNLGFLALGYGVVWAIIGLYAWFIGRRQRALRRQMEQLQLEVEEAIEKGSRQA